MTTWSSEATRAKKAAQAESIPPEWRISPDKLPSADVKNVLPYLSTTGILTPSDLTIVNTPPTTLLSSLSSGSLTALEVTTAFCKAAAVAHQLVNCCTEMMFERALEKAKELDKLFEESGGKGLGALHGLPISLKDQFQIKGVECNMGIASWLGHISEKDSVLVTILEKQGAVLHCRTNVSQALMFGESDNYVYGRTDNPHNRTLTCGGSSGGEGALVALHGSALGVGTDLGGSVRIPAAYNGLFGLRPTLHRFPYAGARNTLLGLEGIQSALGPLSPTIDGVKVFAKAVLEGEPWLLDPKTPEIPWRESMAALEGKDGKKAVFGVMWWDGVVKPQPPMRRALEMTVEAMKKAGYEVIDFEPLDVEKAEKLVLDLYGSDGSEDLKRTFAASGEPYHPLILMPEEGGSQLTVYESWQLNVAKDEYRARYLEHWNATATRTSTGLPIDGLLLPPSPATAHPHSQWHRWIPYTSLFNLLDLPAMSIPIGSAVDPALDPVDKNFQPANARDAEIQASYSPEVYENAPISVQLVGRRYREEEVIGMTELVVEALQQAKK
ncbi:amidase [Peniophora sp. CONT]|nr:amidase [Peniophora sp. CONT]